MPPCIDARPAGGARQASRQTADARNNGRAQTDKQGHRIVQTRNTLPCLLRRRVFSYSKTYCALAFGPHSPYDLDTHTRHSTSSTNDAHLPLPSPGPAPSFGDAQTPTLRLVKTSSQGAKCIPIRSVDSCSRRRPSSPGARATSKRVSSAAATARISSWPSFLPMQLWTPLFWKCGD